MAKRPDAPDYFWFQVLREWVEAYGDWSPQFDLAVAIIGGSDSQELINTTEFCSAEPPPEPDFTEPNIWDNGAVELLNLHARWLAYRKYCAPE